MILSFYINDYTYKYEIEGFEMDRIRYLLDFYIFSLNRWFEINMKSLWVVLDKMEEEVNIVLLQIKQDLNLCENIDLCGF